MKKSKISFSSDGEIATRNDLDETSNISEEYFETEKDPEQIAVTTETKDWIEKNASEYLNIIKDNGMVIGYSFALPCNRILMDKFMSNKRDTDEMQSV